MSMADKLGLGPTRILTELPDGTFRLTVTPPSYADFGVKSASTILTADQVKRYQEWLEGKVLIQNALPDLTADQREVILTGLDDDDFKQLGDPDDDDTEAAGQR